MNCPKRQDMVWSKKAARQVEKQLMIDALRGASKLVRLRAWLAFYWIRAKRWLKSLLPWSD